MERLRPDEQGDTRNRRGYIAEDEDFYFLKLLHQPLAIDVVEGRAKASAKYEQVAGEVFHRTKRCLAEISHREKNHADQPDGQRTYAEQRETLLQHEGGQHRADHGNEKIEDRTIRCE